MNENEEYEFPDDIYYFNEMFSDKKDSGRFKLFTYIDRGSYGVVYANEEMRKVIKIMRLVGRGSMPAKIYDEEVEKQNIANSYGLAPKIYNNGTTNSPTLNNGNDFYYIEMDYLLDKDGWVFVRPPEEKINDLFCRFIKKLVDEAGLCNIVDPWSHFYYNERLRKIYMIDYGKVTFCKNKECKDNCKKEMFELLNLNCDVLKGKGGKSKSKSKSKSKRKITRRKKSRRRYIKLYIN